MYGLDIVSLLKTGSQTTLTLELDNISDIPSISSNVCFVVLTTEIYLLSPRLNTGKKRGLYSYFKDHQAFLLNIYGS